MAAVILALAGAIVAGSFAARLGRQWAARRRPHALAWALALALYAVGMIALAMGSVSGWSVGTFGLYWLTGALLNVPLLAVGELHLLAPTRPAVWWVIGGVAVAWAVVATAVSQFDVAALRAASAGGAIPLGSAVLGGQPAYAALQPLTLTGTVIVLAGTVWSAIRQRRATVLLIAVGVAVAGSSSAFVRSGLDALVPVALTGGVTIMYAGFRASSASRGPATTPART